jgi:glucose/arabinose dehydrogenase
MQRRQRPVLFTILLAALTCGSSGPAAEVTETPLSMKAVRAFGDLRVRRPTVVTNAADGTNRIFFVTQQGSIHTLLNDPSTSTTKLFLDIESRVVYKDRENEEGMLGLAFHPRYKQNGEFFVYYTTADASHTSVVSRFRVSKESPDRADPDSEEELLRIKQPYWNHNGGSITFGPDGYLYISLGDGGAARDPFGNGQNLETILGTILRIDIDRKGDGRAYAIPKDNPFVNHERARSEIWAYGLRNVWGMSFDRSTGDFWAADVGQDIWEEINIIVRGGNYGWNVREGKHPFGDASDASAPDLIEPIWEYHHDVGKSITGGVVYRGKQFPELAGCFLYADYVSGRLWALKYDLEKKTVIDNYALENFNNAPIIAFGEDEEGEVLFTDSFGFIYRLERKE